MYSGEKDLPALDRAHTGPAPHVGPEAAASLGASPPQASSASPGTGVSELAAALSLSRLRWQTIRNHLRSVQRDTAARWVVMAAGLSTVLALGLLVSYHSFEFIEQVPAFAALNEKLISLLFFALLILVVLSTVIVTYTTVFLARETQYFFQLPIPPRIVLSCKIAEAVAFSSWGTLFLGFPVLVSYGHLRDAPALYYLEALGVMLVFLLFAGLVGSILALLVAPLVRRLGPKLLVLGGGLLLGLLTLVFLRSFDLWTAAEEGQLLLLDRFASNLSMLDSPYSPSHWASAAVLAAAGGNHSETMFQGALLLANTLILVPALGWYGRRWYGYHWLASRARPTRRRRARKQSELDLSSANAERPAVRPSRHRLRRSPTAVLLLKDVLVFARDPAQVSQSLLFLALMAIYTLSLLRIPEYLVIGRLQKILYFANLTAICMILSSFTSRFLFPLLSLEGRSFWVLGLAPIRRRGLVFQKAAFGLAITLACGLPMAVVSNLSLQFGAWDVAGAVYTVLVAGICLTALATGLGAAYANFDEDNPSRIAVGVGGTLNFFASALAVALIIGVQSIPTMLFSERSAIAMMTGHVSVLLLAGLITFGALRYGIRSLERREF